MNVICCEEMDEVTLLGQLNEQQQAHKAKLMHVLRRYLQGPAVAYCSELIMLYNLHLHIEVERKDRLGDYSPHLGRGNRISINHNLNPYDFLLTFIHELAHHTAYQKYGNKHAPHGQEWKEEFKFHMRPVVRMHFFPKDIEVPLVRHMQRPKYTHSGDVALMKALEVYNPKSDLVLLDTLPVGTRFKMSKRGRVVMIKGEKRRTYISCKAADGSGKQYLVHAVAKVFPVND